MVYAPVTWFTVIWESAFASISTVPRALAIEKYSSQGFILGFVNSGCKRECGHVIMLRYSSSHLASGLINEYQLGLLVGCNFSFC